MVGVNKGKVGLAVLFVAVACLGIYLATPVSGFVTQEVPLEDKHPNVQPSQGSGQVTVTVLDESGDHIRNAEVKINDSGTVVASGFTDGLGKFTAEVANGTYNVTARAGGYVPNSTNTEVPGNTDTEVTLSKSSGESVGFVDFELKVVGRHTGCALDASYDITNTGDVPFSESGTVGADGRIQTTLPVKVDSSGNTVATDYQLTVDKNKYDKLGVTRSIDSNSRADVRLDPTKGNISVTVKGKKVDGMDGLNNATVSVTGHCPNSQGLAVHQQKYRTNDSGMAEVKNLPPGDYTVNITKFGYESSTHTLSLAPGWDRSVNTNLSLLDPSSISVEVDEYLNFTATKSRSQPLEDANITFHDLQDGDTWDRTTNSSGEAELEKLPPGGYVVEMNKSEETRQGANVGWSRDRNMTTLTIGDTANVTGTLMRNKSRIDTTAVLNGKFFRTRRDKKINLTGSAKDHLLKIKHVETGTFVNLTTDEGGGLAESLPAGAYEVWTEEKVRWPQEEPVELRTHLVGPGKDESSGDAASPPRLLLDNRENWTEPTGVVLVPKLGTALLRVRHEITDEGSSDERPVENATVEVTDSAGHDFRMRTDEHGWAVFPRIHPGTATVDIQKVGYNGKTVDVLVNEWSDGKTARQVLNDGFSITNEKQKVTVDGGGSFDFTVREYDEKDDSYIDSSANILIAHTDDDREERYQTILTSGGGSVGPFPPGQYDIYFQGEDRDQTVEYPDCNAQFVLGNKTRQPGGVSFDYGDGTHTGPPEKVPMELVLRDTVTNEPIETQGKTDVEVTYEYQADACDSSLSEDKRTFQTDSTGEAVSEVRFDILFEGGFDVKGVQIKNPDALSQPYAVSEETLSFPLGFEFIFHMNPNSASVTGQVESTNTSRGALSDVRVRIGRIDGSTDAIGKYNVSGIPNGTFEMVFAKKGYYSNLTDISVEVPPGSGKTVVQRPVDQPVKLEPLPEPKVNVEQPMFGTFLEGVPFEFDWNVTISNWELDQSRPGGDDQIESITYYADIDGKQKPLYSESVNLDPDDLPKNHTLTVNPAELTENLELGETKEIDEFYVVVETRKQGEIRYPKGTTPKADVSIINMPGWLSASYHMTLPRKEKLVNQIHEDTGVPESVISSVLVKNENELYIDLTGELSESQGFLLQLNDYIGTPKFTAMGGLRFRPYRPDSAPDSGRYEFGYQVNLGGQSFPAGDKLLRKAGLGSIGMPMVNLEGSLNGTAFGEIQKNRNPPLPEYESDSEVTLGGGAFVSAEERYLPFSTPFSGALKLNYDESGNADLPRGSTNYDARVEGEGNFSTSFDGLTLNLGKGVPVDVKVDFLFKFQGEVDGSGPGLAESTNPVLMTGGNAKKWTDTGNLTLGVGANPRAGWPGWLSVGQRLGVRANLTEFRMAKPVFSRLQGKFTLSHSVSVLTIGGTKKWSEFAPFELKYTDGSPSTVEFTEVQEPTFKQNRYWTQVNGYDNIRDWSEEGTLIEKAHPHANPRIAVDEDGVTHLVAGHDRESLSIAEGLELRYFNGSADSLDRKSTPFTGINGSFTPAVAAGDGTQWTGFAKFEEYDDVPRDIVSSEIYYASRPGGEWSEPVRVTDNGYTESYVRIASCGSNKAALLWNADETSLASVDDIGLRYAVVNTTGVVRGPVTVETDGVRGEASIACHGDSATVAYPVAGSTDSTDPTTLINPNTTVVTRYATSEGISDPKEVGTGTKAEVIETGKETVLVAHLDETEGEIGYGTVKNGSVVEKGTVARALASDISITEGSENNKVLAWTLGSGTRGGSGVEYATYNGTGWESPKTAVEGARTNRTSLSVAVDGGDETVYLASMESPSPSPVLDERTVNVTVNTTGAVNDIFTEKLKIAGAQSPPQNIPKEEGGLDDELTEDLDGDGDPTDTGPTVVSFGKLLRGDSLQDSGFSDEQARALNWNPFSPETEVRASDMVNLFGKQLRAD